MTVPDKIKISLQNKEANRIFVHYGNLKSDKCWKRPPLGKFSLNKKSLRRRVSSQNCLFCIKVTFRLVLFSLSNCIFLLFCQELVFKSARGQDFVPKSFCSHLSVGKLKSSMTQWDAKVCLSCKNENGSFGEPGDRKGVASKKDNWIPTFSETLTT